MDADRRGSKDRGLALTRGQQALRASDDRMSPSKELCLSLAQVYYEMRPSTKFRHELSWKYLMCWAAHEDWLASVKEDWDAWQRWPNASI